MKIQRMYSVPACGKRKLLCTLVVQQWILLYFFMDGSRENRLWLLCVCFLSLKLLYKRTRSPGSAPPMGETDLKTYRPTFT